MAAEAAGMVMTELEKFGRLHQALRDAVYGCNEVMARDLELPLPVVFLVAGQYLLQFGADIMGLAMDSSDDARMEAAIAAKEAASAIFVNEAKGKLEATPATAASADRGS